MRAWNCPCGWVNNCGPDCGYCGHERPYTKDDLIADLRCEIAELKTADAKTAAFQSRKEEGR